MIGGGFWLWFRQGIHLSYGSSVTDSSDVLFYIDRGKIWPLGVSVLAEKLSGTLSTYFFWEQCEKSHGEVSFVPSVLNCCVSPKLQGLLLNLELQVTVYHGMLWLLGSLLLS